MSVQRVTYRIAFAVAVIASCLYSASRVLGIQEDSGAKCMERDCDDCLVMYVVPELEEDPETGTTNQCMHPDPNKPNWPVYRCIASKADPGALASKQCKPTGHGTDFCDPHAVFNDPPQSSCDDARLFYCECPGLGDDGGLVCDFEECDCGLIFDERWEFWEDVHSCE